MNKRTIGHVGHQRALRPARERLEDQVRSFLAERAADPDLRDATRKQMEVNLPSFVVWANGERIATAADCDHHTMNRFKAYLASRPSLKDATKKLSVQTQNTYLRNVRTFLSWAGVERGHFKLPKPPRKPWDGKLLKPHEVEAMINAAGSNRDKLIIHVLSETGIRLGELLSIRASTSLRFLSGDAKDRLVLIVRPADRRLPPTLRVSGKTGERVVPLHNKLYRALRAHADLRGDDIPGSCKRAS